MKAPITKRALIQRINRALGKDGKALRAARGLREKEHLGGYYIIDTSKKTIVESKVSLVTLGKDVGAIEAWEVLEEA